MSIACLNKPFLGGYTTITLKKNLTGTREVAMEANYNNGVIRDGSSMGFGKVLGNVQNGLVRDGSSMGFGKVVGNVQDGLVRDGSSMGFGKVVLNITDDYVRNGSSLGFGKTVGKVRDFTIKGMERELDAAMVAAYHFLVKKIV